MSERREKLAATFELRFGRPPMGIAEAPGRVNLIGEHVDYNEGLVLPVAIDRSVLVAFARSDQENVRAYSVDFGEESSFRLGPQLRNTAGSAWIVYVQAVALVLTEAGSRQSGVDLAIAGDVPLGGGLSSSAALEVAVAGALRAAWQLDIDDKQLALLCQRAENEAVGVQCGVMDQLASALGRADHALRIDCRALVCEPVPLPLAEFGVALVIVDSGQRRALHTSAYNRRREECVQALRLVQNALPGRGLRALRDVTLEDIRDALLDGVSLRRVRHVVNEITRVERAVGALRCGDIATFGDLMNSSHASLRDDFEVSTPELDRLVELAQTRDYVFGARLTGAGFGGCTVNLVRADAIDAFGVDVVERYAQEAKLPAQMFVCHASDGLRVHG